VGKNIITSDLHFLCLPSGDSRVRVVDSMNKNEARGGGDSAYERGGDARRLAKGCKFQILV